IWTRLQNAVWERVEDSGTGPVRYAAEVGTVMLPAGEKTVRDDGTPFDPVPVRLVVSRYDTQGDQGRGHRIGDHRYELYVAVPVRPEEFAAADVVAAFYARCGQECAFQQQERTFGMQRVFSNHPAGQLLAWIVAFFIWNLRLAAGGAMSPPPPPPPPP